MSLDFKIVIPARLASTRLPNKPLVDICGKPMVVRVAQQVESIKNTQVFIATDSEQIAEVCQRFNLKTVLTSPDCPSGTDRIAEVAKQLNWADHDMVINVQGDEPLIEPETVVYLAQLLARSKAPMVTCACAIESREDFYNPNVVKVVMNRNQEAMYFSRAPIPYPRDLFKKNACGQLPSEFAAFRHIGLYGYRVSFLNAYSTWPIGELDQAESLEQLRALWNGQQIAVLKLQKAPATGVDTMEDLLRIRELWKNTP